MSKVNSVGSWCKNVAKKALALGVPYATFTTATWVLKKVFSSSVNDQIGGLGDTLFLHPTAPYWYLYALFFIFLVTPTFSDVKASAVGLIVALAAKVLDHVVGMEALRNKSILVTGATGTIGSFVADALIRYSQKNNADTVIYLGGRNAEKLRHQFGIQKNVDFLQYDMNAPIGFNVHVDYIIHAAGNAHPAAFNGNPVGTTMGNIESTFRLLEYLRLHEGKRLLYVSSGEVYGQGDVSLDSFDELYSGYLDVLSPRSCYPLSKRMTENLCSSYWKQYGVESVIVRPCHTYGPYMTETDNRAHRSLL